MKPDKFRKEQSFAIFLVSTSGGVWDSYVTSNGVRIGGGVGLLKDCLHQAMNRIVNAEVDGDWKDPFVDQDEIMPVEQTDIAERVKQHIREGRELLDDSRLK